jgi:hypothetical protein
MINVIERFQALRHHQEMLNLYALVDGFQYEQHMGQRILYQQGINRPILHGTEDEPLAHAGPWLVDVARAVGQVSQLQALEQALPSVSWLITSIDIEGLSQLLQLRLEAELPDGRKALLRFYDPRVLGNLYHTMGAGQRAEFFHLVDEWHFIYNGQRVATGRTDA